MLALKKVAVTGGLSAGKTSVCRLFKEFGAYTVDADEIVHRLLSSQTKIGQEVIHLLGQEICVEGRLDRKKIAKIVFSDSEKLFALERLLHPAVIEEIEKTYRQVQNKAEYSLFVVEIPLLYESESEHLFDYVIAVIADPKISKNRFNKTFNESEQNKEFEKRMSRQLNSEEKSAKADFVIKNNGSFDELKQMVKQIYETINLS